jgi:hypothetical protein
MWGLRPDITSCCLKTAVLFLWFCDERTGRLRSYFTTDGQSVCLGVEHPCGTCDQILLPVGMLLSEIAVLYLWGALSDERTGLEFAV